MKKPWFFLALLFCAILLAGSASALTKISDCVGLQAMSGNLSEDYELTNDIDCSATATWNEDPDAPGTYFGFKPIGTVFDKFKGILDGQGHKITGLYINRTTTFDGIGLFGELDGATIKNVNLENINITGVGSAGIGNVGFTGGLAGVSVSSVIINSNVTGTITCDSWSGGLIGKSMVDAIINSSFNGTVMGTPNASWIGGLIGTATSTKICRSFSSGTVNGMAYIGGLVGEGGGIIDCSFSTANVTADSQTNQGDCGGLIGLDGFSTIQNTFARGNVSASAGVTRSSIGGLIGYADGSTITNSFATGQLGDPDDCFTASCIYGLAYLSTFSGGSCNDNFWDTESSGVGTSDCGTGKPTTEMKQQATFTGWDFANTWGIDASKNNGYPYLKCMENPLPLNNAPNSIITQPPSNPPPILEGESIHFRGQGEDADSCDAIQANEWTCETSDGTCPGRILSIQQNPGDIIFNNKGTYTIKYRVQDSTGTWDPTPDERTIVVCDPGGSCGGSASGGFRISSCSLSPASVKPGDPVTASVEVINDGAYAPAVVVSAGISGGEASSDPQDIPQNEKKTFSATFEVPEALEEGNYEVEVNVVGQPAQLCQRLTVFAKRPVPVPELNEFLLPLVAFSVIAVAFFASKR